MSDAALLCAADLGQGFRTVVRNALGPWTLAPADAVFDETSVGLLAWAAGNPPEVRRFVRAGLSADGRSLLCEVWELPVSPFLIAAGATATLIARYTHPAASAQFTFAGAPALPAGWQPATYPGSSSLIPPTGQIFYSTLSARHDGSGETVWLLTKSLQATWAWFSAHALDSVGITNITFYFTLPSTDGLRVLTNGLVGCDDDVASARIDWTGTNPLFTFSGTNYATSLVFSLPKAVSPTFQTLVGNVQISANYPVNSAPTTLTGLTRGSGAVARPGGDLAALYLDERIAPYGLSLARQVGLTAPLPASGSFPITEAGGIVVQIPFSVQLTEFSGRLYAFAVISSQSGKLRFSIQPDGMDFLDYSQATIPSVIDPTVNPNNVPLAAGVVGAGEAVFTTFSTFRNIPTSGTPPLGYLVPIGTQAFGPPQALAFPALPVFVPLRSSAAISWQVGGVFWGVDSLTPANTPVGSGTFFDAVTAQAGVPPAFWGRYIGPKSGNLLQEEVDKVLHKNNCKVLLIYRDTYSYKDKVSTYAHGVFHANQAINYITANPDPTVPGNYPGLTVPGGKSVWIYLNTEIGKNPATGTQFPVLPKDFYRGWLDAMLGSVYGGAGGVYGNTASVNDGSFNLPYCEAYKTGISFMQTDTQAGCSLRQYFGNPVGGGAIPTSGRKAAAGGTPGVHSLTETVLAGESEVTYVLWEIIPGPNAMWAAGNWTVRLNVTLPSHFITWNGAEIVHVDQNCNGIERLGSLDGQSVSLIPPGVKSMVVPGIAPASAPAPGDKILLLLSFSNSFKQHERSFGYTPDQLIDSPFKRVGALVYANQPQPPTSDAMCNPTYRTFSPDIPPCNPPTVIYQYTTGTGLGCPVAGAGTSQMVDYDLAKAAGFTSMW